MVTFIYNYNYIGYFDGSSKPNPGIMRIGGFIKDSKSGKKLYSFSENKGEGTNNVAEYLAIIRLLELAIKNGINNLKIMGDSKLVVMHVKGKWKANQKMRPLRDKVKTLLKQFNSWELTHVVKALNSEADSLTK